ncbi:FxLYD domain-containing protein [Lactiplantibacillus herbarum]|uniref:FxLYD domain-containing protein n=1 Tax=Lactiplantibacillus herbarum TaxID=1670446 RepID=UPI00069D23E0|nr:FxLYD domain-containing protein [Lactiplantibacillus herbarum]
MVKHKCLRGIAGTLLAMLLVLTLVGCSQKKTTTTKYYDKEFVSALEKGLEARWKLTDEVKIEDISKSDYQGFIQAELDQVQSFSNKKLKSTFLQENVIAYINSLKKQKSALKYYNDADFQTKWDKTYNNRNAILVKIDKKYHLKIDKKYNSYLVELRRSGNQTNKDTTQDTALANLLKTVKFTKGSDDGSGYYEYTATVTNNTGYNIKSFSAVVKLKDAANVTVDTQYVNTDNWNKDEKVNLKFTTDKNFKSYEVTKDYTAFE